MPRPCLKVPRSWPRVQAQPFHRSPWAHDSYDLCPLIHCNLMLLPPKCPSLSLPGLPLPISLGAGACLPPGLCSAVSSWGSLFPGQPSPVVSYLPFPDPICAAEHLASSGPTPPYGLSGPRVSPLPQATTRSSLFLWGPPASASRRWLPAGISWVRTVWVWGSWELQQGSWWPWQLTRGFTLHSGEEHSGGVLPQWALDHRGCPHPARGQHHPAL